MIVAIVIVLAAAGVATYLLSRPVATPPVSTTEQIPAQATTEPAPAPSKPATQPAPSLSVGLLSQNLSYSAAINKYPTTRIQFNESCQGSPSAMVVKNGTSIMIDNRADVGKWFTIGGSRFYFNGYAFKIFVIKSAKLPKAVTIDCGTGKNSAVVTLN